MDFNKKYFGIPLAVIILLVGVGIATATTLVIVYETSIPGSVTVENTATGNNYEVTVYKSISCESELTSIDFGSGKPGEYLSATLFIKNTGKSYIPEVRVSSPAISAAGWEPWGNGRISPPLDVGEVKEFRIPLWIKPDAQLGDYSGVIEIVCYGPES